MTTDTTRRIRPPTPVKFFILRNWDGSDGRCNKPSGFIVEKESLAREWESSAVGRDYVEYSGILVQRLEDIPEAQEALKRQKALDKLTDEEKELLGLATRTRIEPGSKIRSIVENRKGKTK